MDITSPYVVVSVIVALFAACIFWGTSSKEDGYADHDRHGTH